MNVNKSDRKTTHGMDQADYELLLADQRWLTEGSLKILNELPLDGIIDHILSYLLQRTESDKVYMIRINWDTRLMHCTHELVKSGVVSDKRNLDLVDILGMDFFLKILQRDHIYHISSLDCIPPESWEIREILAGQGVGSLILAPVLIHNRLDSCIGVNWNGVSRICPITEKQLIRSAAYLISLAMEKEMENPVHLVKPPDSQEKMVRLDLENVHPIQEKVPILNLLDDIHKYYESLVSGDVSLITRIHCPEDFTLTTNGELLRKILSHIMSHTVKTTTRGEIRLVCKLDRNRQLVVFKISHFADESLPMALEPVRELTLLRSLAARLEGHLSYFKERERGLAFELALPLNQARVSA